MHAFDDAVRLTAEDATGELTFRGRTTPAYANMVGPFGGITAATLLQAVLQHPERSGEPLALTVNFAGPVADGEFSIDARPSRTNRSTQHWSLEQRQAGDVVTTASAVLGLRRKGWEDTELTMPTVGGANSVAGMPDSLPLAWLHNYDLRFLAGGVPEAQGGQPGPDSTTVLWVRDHPERPLDLTALTAMCDAFFPRAYLRLGRWTQAGTVTMTIYFHAGSEVLAANGTAPLLGRAHGQRFGDGYFDQTAALWRADGRLLATSHQLVYFKA